MTGYRLLICVSVSWIFRWDCCFFSLKTQGDNQEVEFWTSQPLAREGADSCSVAFHLGLYGPFAEHCTQRSAGKGLTIEFVAGGLLLSLELAGV